MYLWHSFIASFIKISFLLISLQNHLIIACNVFTLNCYKISVLN